MISAKVIADSKNPLGDRITSFEIVMPRIILAEFNTHRAISKNTGSSRAIKFGKMVKMVQENPFIPYAWMKEHKGMQGTDFFDKNERFNIQELKDVMFTNLMKAYDVDDADNLDLIETFDKVMDEFELFSSYTFEEFWLMIRDKIVNCALLISCLGLTKQICNRLLEPFSWIKCVATATELENFFALRAHTAAEIHMQEVAKVMLLAINESTPKLLKVDEWHIPYGEGITDQLLVEQLNGTEFFDEYYNNPTLTKIKIATARCAGTSFTVVGDDGEPENFPKLIKRTNKLLKDGHMSPFEHCAQAADGKRKLYQEDKTTEFFGNFKGFIQFRKTLPNENRKDERLIKK